MSKLNFFAVTPSIEKEFFILINRGDKMDLGKLLNEWYMLKKNSLSSLTFEDYVKAFGSYQECLVFNIYRENLLAKTRQTTIGETI